MIFLFKNRPGFGPRHQKQMSIMMSLHFKRTYLTISYFSLSPFVSFIIRPRSIVNDTMFSEYKNKYPTTNEVTLYVDYLQLLRLESITFSTKHQNLPLTSLFTLFLVDININNSCMKLHINTKQVKLIWIPKVLSYQE